MNTTKDQQTSRLNSEEGRALKLLLIGADVDQVSWWQRQSRCVVFRDLSRAMPSQGKPNVGAKKKQTQQSKLLSRTD